MVTAVDGALQASWNPADSPGSPIEHYDYRLDGGGWADAGPGTSATIDGLNNGQHVPGARCGPATRRPGSARMSAAARRAPPQSGKPFGELAAPTVTAELTQTWGQSVTADWTFPGGNGRGSPRRR